MGLVRRMGWGAVLGLVVALFLQGCAGHEEQLARLQSEIDSLVAQSESKDRTINEFFESMNEIEENLTLIRQKEQSIDTKLRVGGGEEIDQDDRARINERIVEINEIMATNRKTLSELSGKLKRSNLKVSQFEKLLASARQKIEAQDAQISAMRTRLESLNFSMDSLRVVADSLDSARSTLAERVSRQHAELDEAWYAFGSKRELIENQVISSTGGFLGIGKNNRLRDDFDASYFTRVSIEGTDEIALYATSKGVQVVTTHAPSSYELVRNDNGSVEKLRILDKELFWRSSRYLVVIIK